MPQMSVIDAGIQIHKLFPDARFFWSPRQQHHPFVAQSSVSGYRFEVLANPVHPLVLFQALRPVEP
jgi:hypothetical protein